MKLNKIKILELILVLTCISTILLVSAIFISYKEKIVSLRSFF